MACMESASTGSHVNAPTHAANATAQHGTSTPQNIAIIGAGWAGLAAAVTCAQQGHRVTVVEAARTLGGRARSLQVHLPHDDTISRQDHVSTPVTLDNGQHILIGAYSACLQLMRTVGIHTDEAMLRLPLQMTFPDGVGLHLPQLPPPWDALIGIARAKGWSWRDKLALLKVTTGWQLGGFQCPPETTVSTLCADLPLRLMQDLMDPLCVSALNIPAERASGSVFLRVLQDSLFSGKGGSNLLLPRTDLSQLMPLAAAQWLTQHQGSVQTGQRALHLTRLPHERWSITCNTTSPLPTTSALGAILGHENTFDKVLLACPAWEAARLVSSIEHHPDCDTYPPNEVQKLHGWSALASQLQHTVIATVYAYAPKAGLPQPLLALRSSPSEPAQFAIDKGALNPAHQGIIALVISASTGSREALQTMALAQARQQLGLADLQALQTVVEKRATFACTPNVERPAMHITQGLGACGDYIAGPYPATLEGAVRSGIALAQHISLTSSIAT